MIDIAHFIVGTYQTTGPFWDGLWTIARQMKDASLITDALHTMAGDRTGYGTMNGLTQLDPEVISRQLEFYGLGLPQEWTLANLTDQAA